MTPHFLKIIILTSLLLHVLNSSAAVTVTASANTSAKPKVKVSVSVSLGPFPSTPFPKEIFSLVLDNLAVVFIMYDGWDVEQSLRGLFLSTGLGATEDLTKLAAQASPLLRESIVSKLSDNNDFGSETTPTAHVVHFPIIIGNQSYLLQIPLSFDVQLISHIIDEKNATETKLIPQASLRQSILKKQVEIFIGNNDDDSLATNTSSPIEWSPTWKPPADDNASIYELGDFPYSSQLLTRHAINRDHFPTYVINLWHNSVRRQFMSEQLRRSQLGPSYLMPGVDAEFMPQTVLQLLRSDALMIRGHFAAAVAHVQTWREIMVSDVPFALVFEDDIEIDPNIKPMLRHWVPRLPHDWSLLYLDYSTEHYWPDAMIDNDTPNACIAALSAQNSSVIRLDGVCASGSTRAMLVSQRGARLLYENSLPIWRNADVLIRDLIYAGKLDAYAVWPNLATGRRAIADQNASQINLRTIKWDNGFVCITFPIGDDFDCAKEICSMAFR